MTDQARTAIVTGAARGLGLAMTRGLLEDGYRVAMVDLDRGPLEEAAGALCGQFVTLVGDVASRNDANRIFHQVLTRLGGAHILVNNAGLGPQRFRDTDRSSVHRVWEVDLDDWQLYLDANVTGHLVLTQLMIPYFLRQGWGRIVNVTTSLETMINPDNGAYGPSKAAAEALAAMIAGGLEDSPVTCNVLIPGGPADTRMITADGIYADRTRLIRPDVMVAPLRFLVSDAAHDISNRRIRAALWNDALSAEHNLRHASAPIAWPQLGGQAIHPEGDPRGNPVTGQDFPS